MTEQEEAPQSAEETPVELPTLPVMLLDREIYVNMPTPEKILVWQRTINRLSKAPVSTSWTGAEVMAALERLRTIVDSIIVNRADVDWIDDQFLAGTLDFRTLTPFVERAMVAFQEHTDAQIEQSGTRAERRAAKKVPAKKATRKRTTA